MDKQKTYYYCRNFVCRSPLYEFKTSILSNIYDYVNNLTSLTFFNCKIDESFNVLGRELKGLTKLNIIKCSIPDEILPLSVPPHLIKLNLSNNTYVINSLMLFNLPKSIKYISAGFNKVQDLLHIMSMYRYITLMTDFKLQKLFNIDEKKELDILLELMGNKLIYSNNRLQDNYYKPEGELENYCYNCTSNDGVNFNNEIEKMNCIMCRKDLKNEKSIIPI